MSGSEMQQPKAVVDRKRGSKSAFTFWQEKENEKTEAPVFQPDFKPESTAFFSKSKNFWLSKVERSPPAPDGPPKIPSSMQTERQSSMRTEHQSSSDSLKSYSGPIARIRRSSSSMASDASCEATAETIRDASTQGPSIPEATEISVDRAHRASNESSAVTGSTVNNLATTPTNAIVALLKIAELCLSDTPKTDGAYVFVSRESIEKLLKQFTTIRESGMIDLSDVLSVFLSMQERTAPQAFETGTLPGTGYSDRVADVTGMEPKQMLALPSPPETSSLGNEIVDLSAASSAYLRSDVGEQLRTERNGEESSTLLSALRDESKALRERFGIEGCVANAQPAKLMCEVEAVPRSIAMQPRGTLKMSGLAPDIVEKVNEQLTIVNSVPLPACLVDDDAVEDSFYEDPSTPGGMLTVPDNNLFEHDSEQRSGPAADAPAEDGPGHEADVSAHSAQVDDQLVGGPIREAGEEAAVDQTPFVSSERPADAEPLSDGSNNAVPPTDDSALAGMNGESGTCCGGGLRQDNVDIGESDADGQADVSDPFRVREKEICHTADHGVTQVVDRAETVAATSLSASAISPSTSAHDSGPSTAAHDAGEFQSTKAFSKTEVSGKSKPKRPWLRCFRAED